MFVSILGIAAAAGLGFLAGRQLGIQLRKLEKREKNSSIALTADTVITLSLAEVQEAGFGGLVKDLTSFKVLVDTNSGEKFVEIPLEDLLQVFVQKFRQHNLELEDLSKKE